MLVAKILIVFILGFLLFDGIDKMFFHQDDIILLIDAATNFPNSLFATSSEHLTVFFKIFYYLEWRLFHLYYPAYLSVSIILHTLIILTAGKIVFYLTGRKYWCLVCILVLVVNANWFEVLWMSSSQMMLMGVLSSLLCYLLVLQNFKSNLSGLNFLLVFTTAIIPGLNWGAGLPFPTFLLLAYGWRINQKKIQLSSVFLPLLLGQIFISAIYFLSVGSNLSSVSSPTLWFAKPFELFRFIFFGVSYSIVGRYIFPLASRLGRELGVVFVVYWLLLPRHIISAYQAVSRNLRQVLFGVILVFGSYFLIALPRWPFGLGQAAAPHYAYQPMIFITIAILSSFAKVRLSMSGKKNILLAAIIFSLLSLGAFAQVTVNWTERPKKNKILFQYLRNLTPDDCLENTVLPWYIVEVDTWKLKDIWPIFQKEFDPFTGADNCLQIKRDVAKPWSVI